MPHGANPGERRGGRTAGIPNKSTREAIERERIEQQLAAPATEQTAQAAAAAEGEVATAIVAHRKLAKERLEELMEIFIGAAAYHQSKLNLAADPAKAPATPGDWERFEKWGRLAMDCAKEAAKYQSPQFRAIMMTAPAPEVDPSTRRKRFTLTIFETARPTLAPPVTVPTSDQQH